MLDEKQLKEKREALSRRVIQLEEAMPKMQQEAIALRGQVMLINEMLGDSPPPDPPPKAPRKRSKAHGR